MREMLAPIFGDTGAVVAQFVITLVIVLLLVVVVIWLVRRYSQGGLASGGRGRLPRLAIVDAMAVDNRRKLVLIRRDNVEHLILIGGPSDLVVEPGIMRQRSTAGQRQAAAQQATAAQQAAPAEAAQPAPRQSPNSAARLASNAAPSPPPPPPPPPPVVARARPEPVGTEQPIPFLPRRAPSVGRAALRSDAARRAAEETEAEPPEEPRPARPAPVAAPASFAEEAIAVRPPPASARFEETTRPTLIQPSFSLVSDPEPELPPPLDNEELEPDAPAEPAELPLEASADFALPEVEASESVQAREPQAALPVAADKGPDTAVKVSDLEKEMARLLGEISTSRSS